MMARVRSVGEGDCSFGGTCGFGDGGDVQVFDCP